MLGTGINVLKDESQARDIVQDVFLQIWNKRESIEIRTALGAYLKRAVINRCLNAIKQRKANVDIDSFEAPASREASPQDLMELKDLEIALQAALNQLPEKCRQVFVLKRLEGMSQKEIATLLGISTKTVENQVTKALKVLKESLASYRKKNI